MLRRICKSRRDRVLAVRLRHTVFDIASLADVGGADIGDDVPPFPIRRDRVLAARLRHTVFDIASLADMRGADIGDDVPPLPLRRDRVLAVRSSLLLTQTRFHSPYEKSQ